ncbi:outer membrane protein assembly factor BamD [Hydrocarboniphaga sp.]|uniref:outer membrane protein assembly factor BamD n=1 Tax=Hydrocarboniphaga sp. TaxID=2033016 RepID=UPI003D1265EC
MMNFQRLLAAALAAALVLTGAACSNSKKKDDAFTGPEKSEAQLRAEAAALYKLARKSLDQSDFTEAAERYDQLSKRYPFTDYATQGEIEKTYALYRGYDADKALTAADKFIREHPRNPSIDYVQYLKGLTNFNREASFSSMLGVSSAKGDITNYRRSYDDFALLIQKYPTSRYVGDSRQRMIYLRNILAEHELGVVEFYYGSRGAYLAAAKRAEQIVAQYPGAPASYRALDLMEKSYRKAGLNQQADDAARILAAQPSEATLEKQSAAADNSPSWIDRLLKRDAGTADAPAPPAAADPNAAVVPSEPAAAASTP